MVRKLLSLNNNGRKKIMQSQSFAMPVFYGFRTKSPSANQLTQPTKSTAPLPINWFLLTKKGPAVLQGPFFKK